ncbi:ATP-dependent helicase [Solirubrobacter ginsenosidimutans]|uniref:DNA 3'-5' helicase n=1 Tax=Solirubrobacter ginsenosidimutans TaxID=490573 RepID=A0A9X3S202_9ACTN|nr:ATP-dependent helicase [Solirubrobacter ginsenosidimutans]MDA0164010.1 ATP-dependent helicase [Solirubrobacter ginsenosidimutans]
MPSAALPPLVWTTDAQPEGYEVVEFDRLLRELARRGSRGGSLANPAQPWLNRVAGLDALAVLGVRLDTLAELRGFYGYVLEPAWRHGLRLLVECEQRLSQLDPKRFIDPEFAYPYTLERALNAAARIWRPVENDAGGEPSPVSPLDPEQRRAVGARAGTVQIIAPAGSGKTTVLIERVRELLRRGVRTERILATTFNRAASTELQARLAGAGVRAVRARTFHSLGRWLLREEGLGRPGDPGSPSANQFKRLCSLAARETGTWVDVAVARARVSDIKLTLLATPAEFAARHTRAFADGETLARIYALYERSQAERGVNDFDDMVMLAVRALREDAAVRARWQARFSHVLVDEYQDIEPAQELLVRMLAAPEDELFCVGDDDQTLYGFRRASVRRTLDLDLAYPGLYRVALAHNYRCPPEIVEASRRLIGHNHVRFGKTIEPDPGRGAESAIELHEPESAPAGAAAVARRLARSRRGEIVVLARTTNLLRTVALACAAQNVAISAPPGVFEADDAREAIEAYVRLCGAPADARADDVTLVCRRPNRGLPFESGQAVADQLQAGFTFTEAFAGLAADERQRPKLDQAGRVLDALAGMTDARRFLRYLRSSGGLDAYFEEHDAGGTEQIELEVLEQAEAEAAGMSVAAYGALLTQRTDALRAVRDDERGIELATIHGAKGRQWPRVELFGGDEGQLPHAMALDVTEAEIEAGEGEEAERRLAYVAFTRARDQLSITSSGATASRFLLEAGLQARRPYAAAREIQAVASPARVNALRPPASDDLTRVLEQARLLGAEDLSAGMTVGQLFATLGSPGEETKLRPTAILERLDTGAQRRLLRHLRALSET